MTLGEAIRLIRQTHDLTLRDFASQLEVSHVHLCNVEQGKSGVSVELLDKVYALTEYHPMVLVLLATIDLDAHRELLESIE